MSKSKVLISLRLNKQTLSWFKSERPKGYQTLINSVLAQYVQEKTERSQWLAGRAQEIFRQYYAQCFWHYDKDLQIEPRHIELVVDGLKKYGGRDGLRLAEELCQ